MLKILPSTREDEAHLSEVCFPLLGVGDIALTLFIVIRVFCTDLLVTPDSSDNQQLHLPLRLAPALALTSCRSCDRYSRLNRVGSALYSDASVNAIEIGLTATPRLVCYFFGVRTNYISSSDVNCVK